MTDTDLRHLLWPILSPAMKFEGYQQILYAQNDGSGWVAEIPELSACHALMKTPSEAKAELRLVFEMIMEERREKENG